MGIKFIIQLCNADLRQNYFPMENKIIIIYKSDKSIELIESYRLISMSYRRGDFEKLLLSKLSTIIKKHKLILLSIY